MKTLLALGAMAPFLLGTLTWTHVETSARPEVNTNPGVSRTHHGASEEERLASPLQPQSWDAASVRTALEAQYRAWGEARVAYDREAMEAMVVPDFYIQLADRRLSGKAFLDQASRANPRNPLTRFDVEILSVEPSDDGWRLVISEKLEWTPAGAERQAPGLYSLWVTRDGWRREGDKWLATFSEEVGHQNWRDGAPPFEDW